jgi:hypothetical protein
MAEGVLDANAAQRRYPVSVEASWAPRQNHGASPITRNAAFLPRMNYLPDSLRPVALLSEPLSGWFSVSSAARTASDALKSQ